MELTLDRSHYSPNQSVGIELSAPAPHGSVVVVTSLSETVRTVPVVENATTVDLGSFDRGGYGVHLGGSRTAFDVLSSPFERPRYGFVAELTFSSDIDAVARNFRRMHLNLAQFYDWGYRHSQLMPPTRSYTDALGLERDLDVVDAMSAALSDLGTVPLGYSAVYAIGADEVEEWAGSVLLRTDGEPYRLGENFLVLVDPAEPKWLAHYLSQLEAALAGTGLHGFHLDQYGWPKIAVRGDGTRVDLANSYVTLLNAIRDRLPDAFFMFNNVNDFPTWATASAPQDATYIEVWEPHGTLQDLANLALTALALRPDHPPILSAYLSCFGEDEERANTAADLVMATAWSHGASHFLLGESGNALTDPYYPRNHSLQPESLSHFAGWYDFAVRYGDLLFDPQAQDVTETFTGGINEDVTFSGAEFSTKAIAGTVWTRVVSTPLGLVVHLVNLVGQTETNWDRGKNPVVSQHGLTVKFALVGQGTPVYFADVENPDMVKLASDGADVADQTNSLSAGQTSATFKLPDLGAWGVVFLPAKAFS